MPVRFSRRTLGALLIAALGVGAACKSPTEASNGHDIGALQIIDTVVGTGAEAVNGKTVTVHYSGYLYDPALAGNRGLKFDSSVDRNQPYAFVLGGNNVIQGWDQRIRGMNVGGKRTLLLPASLGYGTSGKGAVPPNSALVFDIDLLDVR